MRVGHHITGIAAGTFVAGLIHVADPSFSAISLAAIAIASWFGGVAPDRLEYLPIARVPWVPHRTLTHWGLLWVVGLIWTGIVVVRTGGLLPVALMGFAFGGLIHLLFDWPNPTGVPWFWPTAAARHSLYWWRSGEHDAVLSIVAIAVASVPWILLNARPAVIEASPHVLAFWRPYLNWFYHA
ncbi:MAG: metal-dependent hydrolase [Acidiferrobacter sp.]